MYPLSAVAFMGLCPLRCFLSNHQVVSLSTIFRFINEAMNVLILWYAALSELSITLCNSSSINLLVGNQDDPKLH
ncbi:hypothetical protein BDR03DRAFT_945901 [Suillus americanus]|nr:hypothetical protein BDR03DRAFT_945901 [Suillus americanus]